MKQIQTSSSVSKIRIVFMGTPSFAEPILASLIENEYNVVAVYTRPDAPAGRSGELRESPVKALAQSQSITVEQPFSFDKETIKQLHSHRPDLIIVAAYGKLLPTAVLAMPGFGCINIHPSLLPKFRGPSPLQNTLLTGDTQTGVTLMLMDEGMDTGDIIAQKTLTIEPDEMLPALSRRAATCGASLLIETLPQWILRSIQPHKQDASKATLCQLIEREDGHILWVNDAASIYAAFRALSPWPGVYGFWNRDRQQLLRLKLIRLSIREDSPEVKHKLGEVFQLGDKIGVQSSKGIVLLQEVQLEGKTIVSIEDFLKGYPQFLGSVLQ